MFYLTRYNLLGQFADLNEITQWRLDISIGTIQSKHIFENRYNG